MNPIEQRIFAIRGTQAMIDRFPDTVRFQLTDSEKNERVANIALAPEVTA